MLNLIVASKDDAASLNIATHLLQHYPFTETSEHYEGHPIYCWPLHDKDIRLLTVTGELAYRQDLTDLPGVDLIVFVSRHESQDHKPIFSVHVPGNFSTAEFGGLPHTISLAPANAMRAALREMAQQQARLGLQDFTVYYEGTHHGPSLNTPALFVEIGSTLAEWTNPLAGTVVAHAAIAAIENMVQVEAAVGLGGSHCNRRLTSISLTSDIAFGHIIPAYAFKWLTPGLLHQCVDRTLEANPTLVLDWKGIDGKDRGPLQEVLDAVPYPIRRVSEFRS
jgi:D-aminoacyl-tRNA deacylase